jgi:putative peptidoglycan lipid II flippase
VPAAITGGITQINQIIGQMQSHPARKGRSPRCNTPTASISLPLGVVGMAVGVVLLPELSRALKAGT